MRHDMLGHTFLHIPLLFDLFLVAAGACTRATVASVEQRATVVKSLWVCLSGLRAAAEHVTSQ